MSSKERLWADVTSLEVCTDSAQDGSQEYKDGFNDGILFMLEKIDALPHMTIIQEEESSGHNGIHRI